MVGFAVFLVRRLLGIAVLVWVTTQVAFGLFRLGVPSQLADGAQPADAPQLSAAAGRLLITSRPGSPKHRDLS
jgi:hypothetical protein